MTLEIVILAMIAGFLALRLYAVLGRRAEHGEEPVQRRIDLPQGGIGAPPPVRVAERATTSAPRAAPSLTGPVDRGLRDISAADRRFDITAFLDGAKAAYAMILDAFWRGDNGELARLCDATVAEHFAAAIAARATAGEVLDHRLVRITEATVVDAEFHAPHAAVTVRFIADIAAVTRDGEGRVVAGSLDDAVEVRDIWTFARDIGSASPDWVLETTDEG